MSGRDFIEVADEAALRLLLSRRLRDALLEGMREDGASAAELEEVSGLLMSTAGALVDALGLSVESGAIRLRG